MTRRESIIRCPYCGHAETEIMPTDYCRIYYDCRACGRTLVPKMGDCCVFCSYGTVPCPPVQESADPTDCHPNPDG